MNKRIMTRLATTAVIVSITMLLTIVIVYKVADVREVFELSRDMHMSTFTLPPLMRFAMLVYALLNVVPALLLVLAMRLLVQHGLDESSVMGAFVMAGAILSASWWYVVASLILRRARMRSHIAPNSGDAPQDV